MALPAQLNPGIGITERTPHGYRWIIIPEERSNIASLLGCDSMSQSHIRSRCSMIAANPEEVSDIYAKAIHMDQGRGVCATCSKPAGMDGIMQNAVMLNFHSCNFMLDILQNGTDHKSDGHELLCAPSVAPSMRGSEVGYWNRHGWTFR